MRSFLFFSVCVGVLFVIRPPGTLVPKAFCFSRDVFLNQTQDLRAPSADRLETLQSDQHIVGRVSRVTPGADV